MLGWGRGCLGIGAGSYQDGGVPVVHDVVTEAGAGGGHPAAAEALVEGCEPVGEVDP